MNFKLPYIYSFLLALLLLSACNEPSLIGKDLIADEQLNVRYTEDVPVQLSTVQGDSILTYRVGLIPNGYPCGIFEDPLFGTTTTEIYAELGLEFSNWDFTVLRSAPESVTELDLILPYNTDFSYGVFGDNVTFEVYQLTDDLDAAADYFSTTDTIRFEPTPIGVYTGPVTPFDSVSILDYSPSDTANVLNYPHLRIPIGERFKTDLIDLVSVDTLNVENDLRFQQNVLRGIYIRATDPISGMPVFDLQSREAGIRMVYEVDPDGDGVVTLGETREYLFPFSSIFYGSAKASTVRIQHAYNNSFAEEFVDNKNTQDTMLVQGMVGLLGEVEFPELTDLEGTVVNQAILEFTILDLPGDNPEMYPALDQIRAVYQDESGELLVIEDYLNVSSLNLDVGSIIGGTIETDADGTQRYRLNISNHFQQILDGTVTNKIRLQTVFPQVQRVGRMALGEANFKLTYTEL